MDSLDQTKVNEAAEEVVPVEAVEPVNETTEETPVEEVPAEEMSAEDAERLPLMKTKEEVLARAQEVAEQGDGGNKQELELLKQLYYKYHRADLVAAQQAFVEAGGDPEAFQPEVDPTEEPFKQAMQQIRLRRAQMQAEQEQLRIENLARKQAVIEKIKLLATTPEEAGKSYDAFKELQAEWKEIGPVPAENVSEVWKSYQLYVEQFYDMLKLNIQFREYDFRKNRIKVHRGIHPKRYLQNR